MQKGSIILTPEEIQAITNQETTIPEIMAKREQVKAEKAKEREEYREYMAQRQARLEAAKAKGESKGITNLGLGFEDLLVNGFDARRKSIGFINWDVQCDKGQFDWFTTAGLYFNSNTDEFFYVSSKKVKGEWIQKMYPLTQRGYELALELASM